MYTSFPPFLKNTAHGESRPVKDVCLDRQTLCGITDELDITILKISTFIYTIPGSLVGRYLYLLLRGISIFCVFPNSISLFAPRIYYAGDRKTIV